MFTRHLSEEEVAIIRSYSQRLRLGRWSLMQMIWTGWGYSECPGA